MKPIACKFYVERTDGRVTAWGDSCEKSLEEIFESAIEDKEWQGGRVFAAWMEFRLKGEYYKVLLDCAPFQKILDKANPPQP